MRFGLPAALALATLPSSLAAENWLWFGMNGDQPSRVLTYIDMTSREQLDTAQTKITALAIAETPLASGQISQETSYVIRCVSREMWAQRQRAFDVSGQAYDLPASETFSPIIPGTIAEGIWHIICASRVGHELEVASPSAHSRAAFAATPQKAPDQPQDARLHLVCLGAGSANRVTQTWGNAWNNSGDTVTASILGNREVPFQDQVNLWIEAYEGRLRMPPAMLPGLRGGENGWFELREIKVSDGEITAKVAVNFINKPNLRLNRYSGAISISGKAGDYSGQCQVYNPDAASTKF